MCAYCGYATQPGYPGDVHVDCAKKRITELEAALREIMDFTTDTEDDDPMSNCYVIARKALET